MFFTSPPQRVRNEVAYWTRKALGRPGVLIESARSLAAELRAIMSASKAEPAAHDRSLKVAVVPGHGLNVMALSMDMLWAMALRARGHQPIALMCGKGAPSCEFNVVGSSLVSPDPYRAAITDAASARACDDCGETIRIVAEAASIPILTLAGFAKPDDVSAARSIARSTPVAEIRSLVIDGIPVGDHAFSSTLRVTLRGTINFDSDEEVWAYRRQLISAILVAARTRRFLEQERPDRVLCVHGVYLTHGSLVDVCNQLGIPCFVFGAPYRAGTVLFSRGQTYHRALIAEPNSYWEDCEIDAARSEKLQTYMDSKLAGGRDVVNYHPNPLLDREAIIAALKLDITKPIVSLFTNVIWDAQIFYTHNAFENIFEWLFDTIAYFSDRPDVQLVVRIHPAETKGGNTTRQPMAPEIAKRFPSLPPNIIIVPPESDVSSYTLAEMSRASLVYGTKMALELAYRGLPVVVAGETFNRGKGFTHDIVTREEYFAVLSGIKDMVAISPSWVERARRFAYYLFFQKMMDMPLLNRDFFRQMREPGERYYTFGSIDDLKPGRVRNLDIICDGIINGGPLFAYG